MKTSSSKLKRNQLEGPGLPPQVHAYAKKLLADRKLAEEFWQRTGMYTKSGKLSKHYR